LLWAIPKNINLHMKMAPDLTQDWIDMYYLACPQNFPFGDDKVPAVLHDFKLLSQNFAPYFLITELYIFYLIFNSPFLKARKIRAIAIAVVLYIAACFYLAYGHPMRFALDLNLIRNEQYLRFFMMGYTTILIVQQAGRFRAWEALVLSVILTFLWFRGPFGVF